MSSKTPPFYKKELGDIINTIPSLIPRSTKLSRARLSHIQSLCKPNSQTISPLTKGHASSPTYRKNENKDIVKSIVNELSKVDDLLINETIVNIHGENELTTSGEKNELSSTTLKNNSSNSLEILNLEKDVSDECFESADDDFKTENKCPTHRADEGSADELQSQEEIITELKKQIEDLKEHLNESENKRRMNKKKIEEIMSHKNSDLDENSEDKYQKIIISLRSHLAVIQEQNENMLNEITKKNAAISQKEKNCHELTETLRIREELIGMMERKEIELIERINILELETMRNEEKINEMTKFTPMNVVELQKMLAQLKDKEKESEALEKCMAEIEKRHDKRQRHFGFFK